MKPTEHPTRGYASTMGAPTLSQIHGWDTDHLSSAAEHWSGTADRWESAFAEMHQQAHTVSWEGRGADALRERATADKTVVAGQADQLRQAAGIARQGASDISAAQRKVLYAVEDAQNAGFRVDEDLSVIDKRISHNAGQRAARRAQAQRFAAEIESATAQLVTLDQGVAADLTNAAGGVGTTTFDSRQGKVRMAGFDAKQDGGTRMPSPGLPQPLQDFENQVQGRAPTPTPHAPVTVDDIRRALQVQHDDQLEQLIRESQPPKCTTHDVIKGLGEMAVAGGGAIGAGVSAPSGAGLYLGIATALGSGALAVDDLAKCLP